MNNKEAMMQDFLKQVAEVLEVEVIHESDTLSEFEELDSLGVLSLISMLDANYGVNLSPAEIGQISTFGELWAHVQCQKDDCL